MTTAEASMIAKASAKGERVRLNFRGISCTNIFSADARKSDDYKKELVSAQNPYSCIYCWYDKSLNIQYSICIREESSGCIYQANIRDVEIEK